MDPSYGGCAFLRIALEELSALGVGDPTRLIFGADIDGETAKWAAHLVSAGVPHSHLREADFLTLKPNVDFPLVDAVIGNPPYVRHHLLSAETSKIARDVVKDAGIRLSAKASLWAYFVVHAMRFVKPGGRMALLLPGIAVMADYARPLITHLERNFEDLSLIRIRERIFPEAAEETVALIATGAGRSMGRRANYRDVDDLSTFAAALSQRNEEYPGVKMQIEGASPSKGLAAGNEALEVFEKALRVDTVKTLNDLAQVRLGTVTGANEFFVIPPSRAAYLGVSRHCIPVMWRSANLSGPAVQTNALDAPTIKAVPPPRVLLALPTTYKLDGRTRIGRYIRNAEMSGYNTRTHCKRDPWWSLGEVPRPDAFFTYSMGSPRGITLNTIGAASTNSVHQVTWRDDDPPNEKQIQSIVLASWSSLSRLAAELYGRHYGGGILKLELAAARMMPITTEMKIGNEAWSACLGHPERARKLADEALVRLGIMTAKELAEIDKAVDRLAGARLGKQAHAAE